MAACPSILADDAIAANDGYPPIPAERWLFGEASAVSAFATSTCKETAD